MNLLKDAGLSLAFALITQLSGEVQRNDDKMSTSIHDYYYLESYNKLDDMMLRVVNLRFELDHDPQSINQTLVDVLFEAHGLSGEKKFGLFSKDSG